MLLRRLERVSPPYLTFSEIEYFVSRVTLEMVHPRSLQYPMQALLTHPLLLPE